MSERRRLAIGTVAAVARRGDSGAEVELADRVLRRSASGRDRHAVGGQAEVFEDVCGNVSIRDEREHAQGIAAARRQDRSPYGYPCRFEVAGLARRT